MLRQAMKTGLQRWPTTLALVRLAHKTRLRDATDLVTFSRALRLRRSGRWEEALQQMEEWIGEHEDVPAVLSDFSYSVHDGALRAARRDVVRQSDYERFGLHQAVMPGKLLDALMAEIRAAPTTTRPPAEFHPAYYYSHTPEALTAVRNIHRFLQFDAAQRQRLSDIFAALAAPVESCLGVPARVVNLKAWWTPADAVQLGMNEWHTDGMPEEICKLMLYPFGANENAGTTEFRYADGSFRRVEGPPGVYAIFRNSSIVHRGIASRQKERVVVELTLAPYPSVDWRMASGGTLATYPKLPWAELPY